ncbi:MAG: hypothetical protein R3F62_22960 [Planctomycetota bacterium]
MSALGFSYATPILCVADCAASLVHYERVLGFQVAWRWSEDSAELHDVPERYTAFQRTRDGVVHEYASYFSTGRR